MDTEKKGKMTKFIIDAKSIFLRNVYGERKIVISRIGSIYDRDLRN